MEGRPRCRPKNLGTGQSRSLQLLIRANAALFRVRHEIQEFTRWRVELHRRCFFKRLRDVQPAKVNELECRSDVVSILRTRSGARESDHVDSKTRSAYGRLSK